VTLAAIVRDEKMNAAGGIEDFLECTMPFVSAGVVVDTGSLDGTRDILGRMERKQARIKVYDHEFISYAEARNYSLAQVQTLYALVLDADERLSQEDFEKIRENIDRRHHVIGFNFSIEDIEFNSAYVCRALHNPRLFVANSGFEYKNNRPKSEEYLYIGDDRVDKFCSEICINIKHFRPSVSGTESKLEWRRALNHEPVHVAPSQFPGFELYRELSPMRAKYSFGVTKKSWKKKQGSVK
jgi:glycosyltransferase involved in cell wall biosynthesis